MSKIPHHCVSCCQRDTAAHTARHQSSNCKCMHVLLTPVLSVSMSTNRQSDLDSDNCKFRIVFNNFKSNFQSNSTNQTADVQSNSQSNKCTNRTANIKSNIQSNSQSNECTNPIQVKKVGGMQKTLLIFNFWCGSKTNWGNLVLQKPLYGTCSKKVWTLEPNYIRTGLHFTLVPPIVCHCQALFC